MAKGRQPRTRDKMVEHITAKTRCVGDCWEWQGCVGTNGYGRIRWKRPRVTEQLAHRVSYIAFRGEVPDGAMVCHTCDNRLCVNPEHLFLGSASDNMRDMTRKGRGATSVLTVEAVERIRERYSQGERQVDLAEVFGVSQGTISRVVRGRTWVT